MPYVTIRTIKEVSTPEYKAKLIAKVSDAVADVVVDFSGADKEKVLAHTTCIVEEIPFENWARALETNLYNLSRRFNHYVKLAS